MIFQWSGGVGPPVPLSESTHESMLGNFACFCCCLMTFFKVNFKKKTSFSNAMISVSTGLDLDQDRLSVGPDLDPNCLQSLSEAYKSHFQ